MSRAALLISVTLLLAGVTWAQRSRGQPWLSGGGNDPPAEGADEDDIDAFYQASSSRNQPTVTRRHSRLVESEDDHHDDESSSSSSQSKSGRPARLRPRARRRRPLDPERRRQMILRRQRLGLPIRKRLRAHLRTPQDQVEKTPPADGTSPSPITSTSRSTSHSSTSMSSSTSSTTRGRFPSFRAASKLRSGAKKLQPGWGLKLTAENEAPNPEDGSGEFDLGAPDGGGLTARRPGTTRVLKRPLHHRLTPTPLPPPTTTPVPTGAPVRDTRLRYRPSLLTKKPRRKPKPSTSAPFTTVRTREPNLYESEPNLYEPVAPEPPTTDSYEPEPYYYETEPTVYERERTPWNTPVPRKVILDPLTSTTPRTTYDPTYAPRNPVIGPLDPVSGPQEPDFASTPPYTEATTYAPGAQHAPHSQYAPHALNAPGLQYAPVSQYATRSRYVPDPLYGEEPVYAPVPVYDDPVYAQDGAYAQEPVYDDSVEYSDDYEDTPGIFDQYKYGYNVESEDTGNYHARYEARDGRTVSGSYKVALPDGRVQVVTYVADDQGFRAEVTYDGEEVTPPPLRSQSPQEPHARSPAPQEPHARSPAPQEPHARSPAPQRAHPTTSRPPRVHPLPAPQTSRPRGRPPGQRSRLGKRPPSSPSPQKLHFEERVATASPNPFRLVVDQALASTLAPPPYTTTAPTTTPYTTTTTTPYTDATSTPTTNTPTTTTPTPRTNAHATDNGFVKRVTPIHRPSAPPPTTTTITTTNAHTITPPHTTTPTTTPSTTPVYQYRSAERPGSKTVLYSPEEDTTAYIHTLGGSHAVPFLVPYPPPAAAPHHHHDPLLLPRPPGTHPHHNILSSPIRTYYLSDGQASAPLGEAGSVEILRGDALRPRLSLKIPEPHEADIYPSPPRRYRLL